LVGAAVGAGRVAVGGVTGVAVGIWISTAVDVGADAVCDGSGVFAAGVDVLSVTPPVPQAVNIKTNSTTVNRLARCLISLPERRYR